jgi:hypothetical protein
LEVIELNKWTRVVSAWGNPVKKLILHEHYGAGRSYNFSFAEVNEIVFFVHEHCCTVENLENFNILVSSFGDLSTKNLNTNEWMCIYLKNIGYETPNGFVVNDVCTKINQHVTEIITENLKEHSEITSTTERDLTYKDYESFFEDTSNSSTENRNSMNDFDEASTTEEIANVEEIFPSTTEKQGLWKSLTGSVKSTAKEWKVKVKETWKDVKNSTKSWWSG